jgi:hypothetical protein
MSLGNRQARQSVVSVGRRAAIRRPEPNLIDCKQRQNIGWGYGGIALSGIMIQPGTGDGGPDESKSLFIKPGWLGIGISR